MRYHRLIATSRISIFPCLIFSANKCLGLLFILYTLTCPGYHPNTYGQGLDGYNLLKDATQHTQFGMDGAVKFDNFTCGRIDLMGNIVTKSAPYLYPFVIEFSLIVAAILFVMWLRIGKNPR